MNPYVPDDDRQGRMDRRNDRRAREEAINILTLDFQLQCLAAGQDAGPTEIDAATNPVPPAPPASAIGSEVSFHQADDVPTSPSSDRSSVSGLTASFKRFSSTGRPIGVASSTLLCPRPSSPTEVSARSALHGHATGSPFGLQAAFDSKVSNLSTIKTSSSSNSKKSASKSSFSRHSSLSSRANARLDRLECMIEKSVALISQRPEYITQSQLNEAIQNAIRSDQLKVPSRTGSGSSCNVNQQTCFENDLGFYPQFTSSKTVEGYVHGSSVANKLETPPLLPNQKAPPPPVPPINLGDGNAINLNLPTGSSAPISGMPVQLPAGGQQMSNLPVNDPYAFYRRVAPLPKVEAITLPSFSGSSNEVSASIFLERLTAIKQMKMIPDEIFFIDYVTNVLKEDAAFWYRDNMPFTTYADFCSKFLERFHLSALVRRVEDDLERTRQYPNESWTSFWRRCKTVLDRADPTFTLQKKISGIKAGLNSNMRPHMWSVHFRNLDEMFGFGLEIENLHLKTPEGKSQPLFTKNKNGGGTSNSGSNNANGFNKQGNFKGYKGLPASNSSSFKTKKWCSIHQSNNHSLYECRAVQSLGANYQAKRGERQDSNPTPNTGNGNQSSRKAGNSNAGAKPKDGSRTFSYGNKPPGVKCGNCGKLGHSTSQCYRPKRSEQLAATVQGLDPSAPNFRPTN